MGEFISKLPFFLILHLAALLSFGIAQDTIAPGQSFRDNQSLVSAEGSFQLGFFSPGSSKNRYLGIWYNNISVQTVVWVANRQSPLSDSTGILTIASNGSIILANGTGTVFWSTPAISARSPVAQLLDNGNFVVLDAANNLTGTYAWQGFDYPTDTLLPGMKIGWDLRIGLNRNITVWKNRDDPAPGNFSMAMDTHGVPELFVMAGSVRLSRSGPWVGQRFSGNPEMKTYDMFSFNFVANSDEIYYKFDILNHSIKSKLTVNQLTMNQPGTVQRLVWIDQSNSWKVFWFTPKDQCDSISFCGPYGVCNTDDSPICNCLQGFKPKSPQDWFLRDGSDGCVRKTQLDCRNGTDGFVMVTGAKLPETSNATVNGSLSLGDCRIACLSNCSCTGYASSDVGGGNGCIMWFSELTDLRVYLTGGQDLYVRMAAADLDDQTDITRRSGDNNHVVVTSTVTVVSVMLILGCSTCFIWKRKGNNCAKMKLLGTKNRHCSKNTNEDLEIPIFDVSTIATATNHFSLENKLGEGGFGPVYKGKLGEGHEIAVKRLSKSSGQGLDEFMNEVKLIAKLQHRNLVQLLGCCIQGEEKMLIYEYMHNRSLDTFIFDNLKGKLLTWQTRFDILMGIARGLLYLHQDSRFRIIHRDLKASNILLDRKMNPKISDFGAARIFKVDQIKDDTMTVVGTHGYMSPEYVMNGTFSTKSDVYSFGVLVLEIMTGKRNRGVYQPDLDLTLLGHAWRLWNEVNSLKLLDEAIPSPNITEVLRCMHVGLLCVQERPVDRPEMASVVAMLDNDAMVLPPPKRPGFYTQIDSKQKEFSFSGKESCSTTELTITALNGR